MGHPFAPLPDATLALLRAAWQRNLSVRDAAHAARVTRSMVSSRYRRFKIDGVPQAVRKFPGCPAYDGPDWIGKP